MIAVDANILVYAHRRDSPHHAVARQCVLELAEGRTSWVLFWQSVHEFIGIVTHPRIYEPPSTITQALDQIDAWMESPTAVILTESGNYWKELRAVAVAGRISGPRVHDAHIAALCLEHGVAELWSADRDFSRFPTLRVVNPLVP